MNYFSIVYPFSKLSDINIKVKPDGELGHAMWTKSINDLREETKGSTLLQTQPLVSGLHPASRGLVSSPTQCHDNTANLMGLLGD